MKKTSKKEMEKQKYMEVKVKPDKPDLATESIKVWITPGKKKNNQIMLKPDEIVIPVEEFAVKLDGFRKIVNKDDKEEKLVLALKFNEQNGNVVVYIPENVTKDEYEGVAGILSDIKRDFPKMQMITIEEYIQPLMPEINTIRKTSKLKKEGKLNIIDEEEC